LLSCCINSLQSEPDGTQPFTVWGSTWIITIEIILLSASAKYIGAATGGDPWVFPAILLLWLAVCFGVGVSEKRRVLRLREEPEPKQSRFFFYYLLVVAALTLGFGICVLASLISEAGLDLWTGMIFFLFACMASGWVRSAFGWYLLVRFHIEEQRIHRKRVTPKRRTIHESEDSDIG